MSEPVRITLHKVAKVQISRTNFPTSSSGQVFATTDLLISDDDGAEMAKLTLFHGLDETPLESGVNTFQTEVS